MEVHKEKEQKSVRSRVRGVWRVLGLHQTTLEVVQSRNKVGICAVWNRGQSEVVWSRTGECWRLYCLEAEEVGGYTWNRRFKNKVSVQAKLGATGVQSGGGSQVGRAGWLPGRLRAQ